MNSKNLVVLLLGTFSLTACATAPENLDRSLSFDWKLKPETTQSRSMTVDMGDIFFEWDATAFATHEIDKNGEVILLTQASTSKGNLFCEEPSKTTSCYEDRDSDGQFDHIWSVKTPENSPLNIAKARSPEELKSSLPFRATAQAGRVTLKQKLGLIYDGVQFGQISGQNRLNDFSGRFLMGWHKGKDIPRTANGDGWKTLKIGRTVNGQEISKPATFQSPNTEVKMLSGTADGTARIEVKAEESSDTIEVKDIPNLDLLRAILLNSAR